MCEELDNYDVSSIRWIKNLICIIDETRENLLLYPDAIIKPNQ